MKKKIILLILLVLMTGCQSKKVEEPENTSTKKLYTCKDKYETYYFYFDEEDEPYYRATYYMNYQFNTEEEALNMNKILSDEWNKKYLDSNMEINLKTESVITYISITAHNNANQELFKEIFGDRYNMKAEEINNSFNGQCYIKSI